MTPEEEANIKCRQRCLDAFLVCKTKEDLKASADIMMGVIKKLPEEDRNWLRDMYVSKMRDFKDVGDPTDLLNKQGKKYYKENCEEK